MLDKLSSDVLSYLIPLFKNDSSASVDVSNIYQTFCTYPKVQIDACLKSLFDDGYLHLLYSEFDPVFICALYHKAFSFNDPALKQVPQSQVFNIGTVNSSAFGNNGDVTLNVGASFDELKSFIKSQDIPQCDKDSLVELTTQVETMINNEIPFKKGFLSKFKNVIETYDGYIIEISKLVFGYFTGINQVSP